MILVHLVGVRVSIGEYLFKPCSNAGLFFGLAEGVLSGLVVFKPLVGEVRKVLYRSLCFKKMRGFLLKNAKKLAKSSTKKDKKMYIITVKSNKNDYWRSLVQDAKIGACLAEYESDNQSHRFMVFESIEEAKSYRDEDFAKMLRDYEELEECKLTSSIEYVSNARLRRIYNER